MFTLKMFRRDPDGRLSTKIITVDYVTTHEIMVDDGDAPRRTPSNMIEIQARNSKTIADYDNYFIGELPDHEKNRKDSIIDWQGVGQNSRWGWAVLENEAGNTTQHFRPASYG